LGTFIDILAVVELACWILFYFMLREGREHIAEVEVAPSTPKHLRKPSLFPKCWEMSRCRPSVRQFCPNYISKTVCWKRRGGCLCDQGIADQMILSSGRGEAHEVIEMQQKASLKRGVAKSAGGGRPKWSDQKRLCYSCPLFTEHQDYKFRHFSWLSFPFTAIIIALFLPLYELGYSIAVNALDKLLHTGMTGITNTGLIHSPFEWVVLGIITLLLWTFMVSMVDRIFMRWKL
jgi:hypothetical protein